MVFERVKEILCDQLDIDEANVTMESAFVEDLGADSLDFVDLLMSLEAEFEIEINDEEMKNIRTVGDIVKFIEQAV